MKRLALVLLLLVVGCSKDPIETMQSNNPNFSYSYLFTIKEEGVRVYRFSDGGYARYVAVGDPKQIVGASWGDRHYQSAGKTMTTVDIHQTLDTLWR